MGVITPKVILVIHDLIHGGKRGDEIKLKTPPATLGLQRADNGVKFVDYEGVRFFEQNKRKNSPYGEMARGGYKITWALVGDDLIRVVDDIVSYRGKKYIRQ